MRRLGSIVACVLIVAVAGAVGIATRASSGDDGEPTRGAPAAGDLARLAAHDGAPRLILASDGGGTGTEPTCDDLWTATDRVRLAGPLAEALSRRLGEEVDPARALSILDGACQTRGGEEPIGAALADLGARAALGPGHAEELCRAWTADLESIRRTGEESARASRAVFAALGDGGDLESLYAAVVTGEKTARAASDATMGLGLATRAGRVAAEVVAGAQREVANADRRFIGRSRDLLGWRTRPTRAADLARWRRVTDGIAEHLRASGTRAGLRPGLVGADCRGASRAPGGS